MAKKVQPQPVSNLPPPSSSDDETEDQEGSSSSSSTDDEQQQQHHPPQPQEPQESEESDDETEPEPEPVLKKPSLQEPQESQESDDDSDADSDDTQDSPSASAFTIKPIVQKPVTKSPEPKTPVSKTTRVKIRAKRPAQPEETDKASKPVSKNQDSGKAKGGNSKRPAEIETEKIDKVSKNKKSKVSNGDGQSVGKGDKGSKSKNEEGGEVEEKKSIIKWSEKDEIALLGGIIDYKEETGDDVNSKTTDAFYEYAKDLLAVNLTKNQLFEKIKRLKKKFQTNEEKCQNGEEPVFSKPHENKLFELSQKIWGSERNVTEGNDSKVKSSKKKGKKDGIVAGTTSTPLESVPNKKDGIVVGNISTPTKSAANRDVVVQEEVKDTIMEDKKEETRDFWSLYPLLCASLESEASSYLTMSAGYIKEHVKETISGMGVKNARELEEGWKSVQVMERQLYVKRVHLINKQAEATLDLLRHLSQ